MRTFADTAAVLALCDLVVTVDTVGRALAGALGRPLFVLLPFRPDWRWTLDREREPLVSGDARLFRQGADRRLGAGRSRACGGVPSFS